MLSLQLWQKKFKHKTIINVTQPILEVQQNEIQSW